MTDSATDGEPDDNILDSTRRRYRMIAPPLFHPSGIADLRVDSAIKRHVSMVLDYCDGNKDWAADELGVDISTLWRWVMKPRLRETRLKQAPPRKGAA